MEVMVNGQRLKLKKLEPEQRRKLKLLEAKLKLFRLYGGNGHIKQCKRLVRRKADKGWPSHPVKNTITDHPRYLQPIHVEYMLLHNVQLPDPDIYELTHGCADPNPKKKIRKGTHARNNCFEGTHGNLKPHEENTAHTKCHNKIKAFVRSFRKDKTVPTKGTIFVADIRKYDCKCKHRCTHRPRCFGNFN